MELTISLYKNKQVIVLEDENTVAETTHKGHFVW